MLTLAFSLSATAAVAWLTDRRIRRRIRPPTW